MADSKIIEDIVDNIIGKSEDLFNKDERFIYQKVHDAIVCRDENASDYLKSKIPQEVIQKLRDNPDDVSLFVEAAKMYNLQPCEGEGIPMSFISTPVPATIVSNSAKANTQKSTPPKRTV